MRFLAAHHRGDTEARTALSKARQLYGALDWGAIASVVPDAMDRIEELNGILDGDQAAD